MSPPDAGITPAPADGLTEAVRRGSTGDLVGRGPYVLALVLGGVFHGGLLFGGSWRGTYDAWVHIFFADHYQRSWFEMFEPRWYTGFSVASYPPAAHQLVAAVGRVVGLEAAYAVVQVAAVLLLIGGVHRFASLWVGERSAGFAALGMVLSTSLVQTVHVFGQLPTILSMAILLHASAAVVSWLRSGDVRALGQSVLLVAASAAVHHVTIIFGAVFILGSLGLRVLAEGDKEAEGRAAFAAVLGRGLFLGLLAFVTIGAVLLPYWIWSAVDPIRQVPIPHGSRDDFFSTPASALMFFVIPWGAAILGWGYVVARGLRRDRWPLTFSMVMLTLLGLGGTTPVARAILGGAFDVLALDRFTFWAIVVASPLLGDLFRRGWDYGIGRGEVDRRGKVALRTLIAFVLVVPAFVVANLSQLWRLQPDPIDSRPVVEFLAKDRHWQWRYLTLGMGDQLAGLAAGTEAGNVEGDYHSARRLPVLVAAPIERLDGAKFAGQDGIDALRQVLTDPDDLGLKFVFSNDRFYDPLLHFTGWTSAARLRNGVVVWERAGVALPAPPAPAATDWQDLWWGIVPPLMAVAGLGSLGQSRWRARHVRRSTIADTALIRMLKDSDPAGARPVEAPASEAAFPVGPPHFWLLASSGAMGLAVVAAMVIPLLQSLVVDQPEEVAEQYLRAVIEGRFEDAFRSVDPAAEVTFEQFLSDQSLEVGLDRSFSRVLNVTPVSIGAGEVQLNLETLDGFGRRTGTVSVPVVERSGDWFVEAPARPRLPEAGEVASRAVEAAPWLVLPEDLEDTRRLRPDAQAPTIRLVDARAVMSGGLVHVVGSLVNGSGLPADVSVSALIRDPLGSPLTEHAAGEVMTHQLLPGEETIFRITFEGVAGRVGTRQLAEEDLGRIDLTIGSVVSDQNTSRSLVVEGLAFEGTRLQGSVANVGALPVVVPALLVGWFQDDRLVWAERTYLSEGVRPAARRSFELAPPGDLLLLSVSVVRVGVDGDLELAGSGSPGSASAGSLAGADRTFTVRADGPLGEP
jgi:hypothetical protein